jgi:integrase
VTTFAYWTGCRCGEILNLRWQQVDLLQCIVRLEAGETKNDEPRIIPLAGELLEMLKMQKQIREERWPACPWPGYFFEQVSQLRRSTARGQTRVRRRDSSMKKMRLRVCSTTCGVPAFENLVRAGVPERVAMAISGHRTRSVFDRYNIVSERDLREAARRLNAYVTKTDKKRDGDNMVTVAQNNANRVDGTKVSKLLN